MLAGLEYVLISKGNFLFIYLFLFYFTAAAVKCCMAAVICLPALYKGADYMFISFGIV